MGMCLQVLPRLQISGWRFKFEVYVYNYPSDLFWGACLNLEGRPLPSQLTLTQLALTYAPGMPVGVAFPNLQTLYLLSPVENLQICSELPSLTELVLKHLEPAYFEQVLSQLGHQLIKLSVIMDNLHLDKVFRMCPNLQVFYVAEIPLDFIGLVEPLENLSLSCLTELRFLNEFKGLRTLKTEDLLQILKAAPNLRILHLDDILFSEQGGVDICIALKQRFILQHLKQFVFAYGKPEQGDDPEILQSQKYCFAVFRCMIRLCPKLSKIKEVVNYTDV